MQRKGKILLTFFIFISVSIVLILIAKTEITNSFQKVILTVLNPVQSLGLNLTRDISYSLSSNEAEKLSKDVARLATSIVNQDVLVRENKALQDQFKTPGISTAKLLPARIVGSPGFIPGVSSAFVLILDKGQDDKVMTGDAVVYKNHLIGRVTRVSSSRSVVDLVTSQSSSFTARTAPLDAKRQSAVGVIKGRGTKDMILDNVVLSETLKTSDIVVTNGSVDEEGNGLPPDLIVGKVVSVEKKSSALFQTAQIARIIDPTSLSTAFVIISR